MTRAPFTVAIARNQGDPRCEFCGGTGELRLPTTGVYDLVVDCDCARPVAAEVEAERAATWTAVLGE